MSTVNAYHSTTQAKKPEEHRIYHDNDRCLPGRGIPLHERRSGDNGYRLCLECLRIGELAAATTAAKTPD